MFEWNSNAKINGGELLTSRRPNKKFKKNAYEYETCAKCLGSLSDKGLSHHFKKCTNNSLNGERIVKELSRAVEGRIHPNASEDLAELIIPKMQEGASVRAIRFDWLIIEFGNDLCLNYSPLFQKKLIRDKLRDAGKLLVAAKSISAEITDFSSLFRVKNCNVVVAAVRRVSKFDLNAKKFGSPGTATTLVTLIKAIGDLLIIERMKEDDIEQENAVERFLKVFGKDAKLKILKLAYVTQANAKRGRDEDIPSTDDVGRLATYLDCERDKCFAELSQTFSYEKWKNLSELSLASILVFNRRRTGEMSNITVSEFQGRVMIANHRDKLVSNALPEYTSRLIRSRMKIRGKLNRTVPVLLKHSFDECLQLLLVHRKDARIPDENEFLFGLRTESGRIKTVDACAVMRKFSNLCAAENPGSLRGTKLRKHMASMCATMNLNDNDVTNVANFMGHDDQIHRNVYRSNTLQNEVIQMTTVLEAAQGKRKNSGDKIVGFKNSRAKIAAIKNSRAKIVAVKNRRAKIAAVKNRRAKICDIKNSRAKIVAIKNSRKIKSPVAGKNKQKTIHLRK